MLYKDLAAKWLPLELTFSTDVSYLFAFEHRNPRPWRAGTAL